MSSQRSVPFAEQAEAADPPRAERDPAAQATGPSGQRDYFAEMYVAGVLADAGWDVYFPRRDKGFDMIVSRPAGAATLVRPVQVKGKYSTDAKGDTRAYGYDGILTALHDDMVVAMPFFTSATHAAPCMIAWLPRAAFVPSTRGWRCHPARFAAGAPKPRRDFARYFDAAGLARLATRSFPASALDAS